LGRGINLSLPLCLGITRDFAGTAACPEHRREARADDQDSEYQENGAEVD
jgi:hypothetical protein